MSAFADILQVMVSRIPGAIGAVFADWEGEAVDEWAEIPTLEIRLVGAHWGVVLNQAARRLQDCGAGSVEELLIEGDRALVFIRRVTERYYVVLCTQRQTHLGIARRELERGARNILGEM